MRLTSLYKLGLVAGLLALQAGSPAIAQDNGWTQSVYQEVGKHLRMPRSAIMRGIEGVVKAEINIDAQGALVAYNITQTSGSDLLDAEATRTLEKISRVPAPPSGQAETLTLTLQFKMPS